VHQSAAGGPFSGIERARPTPCAAQRSAVLAALAPSPLLAALAPSPLHCPRRVRCRAAPPPHPHPHPPTQGLKALRLWMEVLWSHQWRQECMCNQKASPKSSCCELPTISAITLPQRTPWEITLRGKTLINANQVSPAGLPASHVLSQVQQSSPPCIGCMLHAQASDPNPALSMRAAGRRCCARAFLCRCGATACAPSLRLWRSCSSTVSPSASFPYPPLQSSPAACRATTAEHQHQGAPRRRRLLLACPPTLALFPGPQC
jgi:hypothetical protein